MAKKKKNKQVGVGCSYVGWEGDRVVCYTGKIIEDLGENMKCRMIDRYKDSDKTPFEIILPAKKIKAM